MSDAAKEREQIFDNAARMAADALERSLNLLAYAFLDAGWYSGIEVHKAIRATANGEIAKFAEILRDAQKLRPRNERPAPEGSK